MDIQVSGISMPLGVEICHDNKSMGAKERRKKAKLDEELYARLGYDATDPRTEMVHLGNAAIHLTAVMRSIRLEIQACRAKWWAAVVIRYEDIP